MDSKKIFQDCCNVIDENCAPESREKGFTGAYRILINSLLDDIKTTTDKLKLQKGKGDSFYFGELHKCYRQVREQGCSVARKLNKKYPKAYFTDYVEKPFPEDYDRMTELLFSILTAKGSSSKLHQQIERQLLKPMFDMRALDQIARDAALDEEMQRRWEAAKKYFEALGKDVFAVADKTDG